MFVCFSKTDKLNKSRLGGGVRGKYGAGSDWWGGGDDGADGD